MTTDAILYGAVGGSATTSDLYTIDPRSGTATSIGACGFALTGLAYDIGGTTMYGATSNNSTAHSKSLISVNLSTGAGTFIGSFGGGVNFGDIVCDSTGQLYGFNPIDHKLYTINKSTGAAAAVGVSGITSTSGGGLAIDGHDVLYVFPNGTGGFAYTLDKVTGAATIYCEIDDLSALNYSVAAAAIGEDGIVYVSANDFGSPVDLAQVNLARGTLGVIGPTLAGPPLDALSWNQPPAYVPAFNGPTWVHEYATTAPTLDGTFSLVLDSGNSKVYRWLLNPGGGTTPELWSYDGSDWTLEAPAHTPPGIWSLGYDPVNGYLLTLANLQTAGVWASETWKYDGSDWTQLTVATPPQPLYGYGMAYDLARGNLVLFGGANLNTNVQQGNTYTWDGTDWTLANIGVRGTTCPSATADPGMAYDKIRQKVVAYGGTSSTGDSNETWTWDGTSWTKLSPGLVPGNQNIGIAWSDNAHGVVMLLNSARVTTGPTQNQNPTFVWNGTNWAQVLPLTTRLSPPAVGTGSPPNAHSSGLAGSAFLFSLFDESNTGSFAQYNPRDPWQFFYSPTLTTNAASGTFFSGTTLNGTTLGLDSVTWQFEWGTDRTYGNTTAGGTASSGTQSVSENLTGLTPSTTYFYRLTGSSSGSPVFFGDPVSFTTDALVDHPTLYCQFSLH